MSRFSLFCGSLFPLFWLFGSVLSLGAQSLQVRAVNGTGIYRKGDLGAWVIEASGDGGGFRQLRYEIKTGGLTSVDKGDLVLSKGRAILYTTAVQSAWNTLTLTGLDAQGASFTKVGGALFAPDLSKPSRETPEDFEAFWQAKLAVLADVPMEPVLTPAPSGLTGVDYALVKLGNIHGTHVQGQLAKPSGAGKFPALLVLQWAGVYSLDRNWVVWRAQQGWLTLNIQAHDIDPINTASYYEALNAGPLSNYPAIGNENRETSYFLRLYLACHRAAEYLCSREDWDGRVLVVTGASQGGLQALVAAALHPKVTAVLADVPAGCDEFGAEAGRVPGWPYWYWQTSGKDAAKVLDAGRYYDVGNFTPKIRCPVLVNVGLLDTVCPPLGIFTAVNRIPVPREVLVDPEGEHSNAHETYSKRAEEWLALLRAGKDPQPQEDQDGGLLWSFDPGLSSAPDLRVSAPAQGPEGNLYYTVGSVSENRGWLCAVGAKGSLLWTQPHASALLAPPAVGEEGLVYMVTQDGWLKAFDPQGELRQAVSLPSAPGAVAAAPVALGPDGRVYCSASEGSLLVFSAELNLRAKVPLQASGAPVLAPDGSLWVAGASGGFNRLESTGAGVLGALGSGSQVTGAPALGSDQGLYWCSLGARANASARGQEAGWSWSASEALLSEPVQGREGTVYVVSEAGSLHALSENGNWLWTYKETDSPQEGVPVGSALARDDGSVVYGGRGGLLHCVDAGGGVRWQQRLSTRACSSVLLGDNQVVYVTTQDGLLHALQSKEPSSLTGWPQARRDARRSAWQPEGLVALQGRGRLISLSVRAEPGTQAGDLVAGFALVGSGERSLLLRAVGPELVHYGIDKAMPDPFLGLFGGAGLLASNEDWFKGPKAAEVAGTAARLGDFPLSENGKDAALLASLEGGTYTVYPAVEGRPGGVALLEIYDAGAATGADLVSLSARNEVGTGSGILVAGFAIAEAPCRLLLQGIGPSLGKYLSPVIQDPELRLFRGTRLIAQSRDWGRGPERERVRQIQERVFSQRLEAGSRDAALVVTLEPGLYSVELRGTHQLTGPGMIEIYQIP